MFKKQVAAPHAANAYVGLSANCAQRLLPPIPEDAHANANADAVA